MLIGGDVTEKLSIVPAEFFVESHIYLKYALPALRNHYRRAGRRFGH